MQDTFAMVKPEAVAAGKVGTILGQIEANGFRIERVRTLAFGRETAEQFYAVHKDRPFFPDLIGYITSGPVVAMQWSGESAVVVARTLMGTTNPAEAAPGTIRGDFGMIITENIVHGSDSPTSAERELGLYF